MSFVCHPIIIQLVVSYWEGEDDVELTHLPLSLEAAITDPHRQGPEDGDKLSQLHRRGNET